MEALPEASSQPGDGGSGHGLDMAPRVLVNSEPGFASIRAIMWKCFMA
jgi:hypothetical protein